MALAHLQPMRFHKTSTRAAHPSQSGRKAYVGEKPFPAEEDKGAMERRLDERYGHARKTNSLEPTASAKRQGASNAGEDASSGCETISADPTRFPREDEQG
jgi:hypothetical protein